MRRKQQQHDDEPEAGNDDAIEQQWEPKSTATASLLVSTNRSDDVVDEDRRSSPQQSSPRRTTATSASSQPAPPPQQSENSGGATSAETGIDMMAISYAFESFRAVVFPVSITMVLSALAVNYVTTTAWAAGMRQSLENTYTVVDPADSDEGASTSALVGTSLLNGLVMIGLIAAMTFLVVACLHFGCTKLLYAYLLFAFFSLLFVVASQFVLVATEAFDLHRLDKVSYWGSLYNFAVVGTVSIFWSQGLPVWLTQSSLVAAAVLVAWQLSQFDPWTAWMALVLLSFYDLVAVLTPWGPLKALINVVSRENGPSLPPGLLFEARLRQQQNSSAPRGNTASREQLHRQPVVAAEHAGTPPSVKAAATRMTRNRSEATTEESLASSTASLSHSYSETSDRYQVQTPTKDRYSIQQSSPNKRNHVKQAMIKNVQRGGAVPDNDDDDNEHAANPHWFEDGQEEKMEDGHMNDGSFHSALHAESQEMTLQESMQRRSNAKEWRPFADDEDGSNSSSGSDPAPFEDKDDDDDSECNDRTPLNRSRRSGHSPPTSTRSRYFAPSQMRQVVPEQSSPQQSPQRKPQDEDLERPQVRVPLALARLYRLPLADNPNPPWRTKKQTDDEGEEQDEELPSSEANEFTVEQLVSLVDALVPRRGGRIEAHPKQRPNTEIRYRVLDHSGKLRRIIFVGQENGVVYKDPKHEQMCQEASSSERIGSDAVAQPKRTTRAKDTAEPKDRIRLGLGDFIFYSVLVALAAQNGGFTSFAACFVVILNGLCTTLLILALTAQALPALPISILAAIVMFALTQLWVREWVEAIFLQPGMMYV